MMLADKPKPKWRGYTWAQLQTCAELEVKWRCRNYPNRILSHRMTQDRANMEIDMMRVIAEHLAELAEGERLL
jgi:hypothetical protein